ncbi:MAG: hypothetical protein HUU38_02320 [Anaerolineales bacterium]|nr:hypothetical protein [Anaerolineales bacterium]
MTPTPILPSATLSPGLPSPTPTPHTSIIFVDLIWIDETVGWAVATYPWQILRTEDGGQTWQDVSPSDLPTAQLFSLNRLDAWIVQAQPDMLYRTQDGGLTWEIFQLPFTNSKIKFWDASTGYAVATPNGCGAGSCLVELYQSSDGGETWRQVMLNSPYTPPTNGGVFPGAISIISGQHFSMNNPSTLWLTGGLWVNDQHGNTLPFWVSWDTGTSWQPLQFPMPDGAPGSGIPKEVSPPIFLNDHEGYLATWYTDDTDGINPQGFMAFFYTEDGGQTWVARPGVVPIAPYRGNFDIVSPTDIFVLCEKTLCVTHDGAQTWQTIASNIQFESREDQSISVLDFVSPSIGWIFINQGEGQGTLLKTTDGGVTWELFQYTVK